MTCQQPGDRRVCDAKSAGGLSDAGSVVYRRASCPQVLVGQHSKAGAGVNTGCDESLPNRLDVEPVLLRNLHLSQTGRVIGHERRVRRNLSRRGAVSRGVRSPGKLSPCGASRRYGGLLRSTRLTRAYSTPLTRQRSPRVVKTDQAPSSLRSNAGTQD